MSHRIKDLLLKSNGVWTSRTHVSQTWYQESVISVLYSKLGDGDRRILGSHWSAVLVLWGDPDSGRDSVSKTRWPVTQEGTDANL